MLVAPEEVGKLVDSPLTGDECGLRESYWDVDGIHIVQTEQEIHPQIRLM